MTFPKTHLTKCSGLVKYWLFSFLSDPSLPSSLWIGLVCRLNLSSPSPSLCSWTGLLNCSWRGAAKIIIHEQSKKKKHKVCLRCQEGAYIECWNHDRFKGPDTPGRWKKRSCRLGPDGERKRSDWLLRSGNRWKGREPTTKRESPSSLTLKYSLVHLLRDSSYILQVAPRQCHLQLFKPNIFSVRGCINNSGVFWFSFVR